LAGSRKSPNKHLLSTPVRTADESCLLIILRTLYQTYKPEIYREVAMDFTRREIIKYGSFFCLSTMLGIEGHAAASGEVKPKEFEIFSVPYSPYASYFSGVKSVVSIVKVNEKWSDGKAVEYAVTKALDLIGGLDHVLKGKERILIKPNLVNTASTDTTKPVVIEVLTSLMKKAGKNVSIGEASSGSMRNFKPHIRGYLCSTKDHLMLQGIQDDVFEKLGYSEVSKKLDVPLINLHLGKMAKMTVPDNFVFKEIYIHEDLYHADMVCSVPMMKTHGLAGVTLALKNIGIGAFPGMIYGTVRSDVHRRASEIEPTGTSTAIIDMVKVNKIGLSVIDATWAMQGQGPSVTRGGELIKSNLIIAGTNPLAVDLVGANVMGFETDEIDTFKWAFKAGMKPRRIDEIQIVGEKPADVRRPFKKPAVVPYTVMEDWYGPPC
jgi:uncharacterized protein (DUF362 family)